MERCCRMVFVLLCTACAVTFIRAADVAHMCDDAIAKITTQVQAKQYIEAINSAADYETALRAGYPSPTYDSATGLFQCAYFHIALRNPVAGMKLDVTTTTGLPFGYNEMGYSWLANFVNADGSDHFISFVFDSNQIAARSDDTVIYGTSDKKVLDFTKDIMDGIGAFSDEQFVMAGPHRVLLMRVTTSALQAPKWLVTLVHDKAFFFFYHDTLATSVEQSRRELLQMVSTVTWDYCPADTARIAAIRAQHSGSIAQTLACSRELAMIGEFTSAAQEIANLRSVIAAMLPKPYIAKNMAYLPTFQITLRNPNPTAWEMAVGRESSYDDITLVDKTSVPLRAVVISATGLHQRYGNETIQQLTKSGDTAYLRCRLKSCGRTRLLNISRGPLRSESFTTFKGHLAYQGVIDMTEEHQRAKGVFFYTPRALVMMVYVTQDNVFAKDITNLEAIAANCLSIK